MKRILLSTLLLSSIVRALSPEPAAAQKQQVVYHNAVIHVGNGKVLNGATIAFDKGVIKRVGFFKMKWSPTDIDLKGKHIYPGFILPVTNLGLTEVDAVKATQDSRETGSINPNVRSIVAFNTDSEITPTMRYNGILLAQPTPRGGLVSGLSSVVQLDAWNWEDAAVQIDDAIHVNWPSPMKSKFDMATFSMKTEENKDYPKQIEKIKSLFEDAKMGIYRQNNSVNVKLDAVFPAFSGKRKVYIHSNKPKVIIEAINYFKQIGIKNIVLVSGQGALPIVNFLKENNIPVIVSLVHQLPKRADSSVDAGYTTAIKLHKAGLLVALAYGGGMTMGSRNLAFTAGTLVAYGMSKENALQLITGNTAKILGVDKRYGTLETGKSATLIITQGDALDMRENTVIDAYIDGRKLNLDGRQQALNKRYLKKYGFSK